MTYIYTIAVVWPLRYRQVLAHELVAHARILAVVFVASVATVEVTVAAEKAIDTQITVDDVKAVYTPEVIA